MNVLQKEKPHAGQTQDAGKGGFDRLPFRIHPRVFESLGKDLVTDDIVAVIELVKNSYDALARNVRIRFYTDNSFGYCLEVEDDGEGMTKDVLEHAWCVVATPFKAENPLAKGTGGKRRVVGEKGLGRLSTLRIGKRLHMLTQAQNSPCWEVKIDWPAFGKSDSLSESFADIRKYPGKSPFPETGSGTRLTIHDMSDRWERNKISDLGNNLSRLISPFTLSDEFNISLEYTDGFFPEKIKIEAPEFLENPKYLIRGRVDEKGNVRAEYRFTPVSSAEPAREKTVYETWGNIYGSRSNRGDLEYSSPERASCGPFDFEIRAWDLSADDTGKMADRFGIKRSQIRKAIRVHKGLSIYRDGVLVLPKSDKNRDWLGLDLRRVSRIGTRLSTNQILGYVSVSAEGNPEIRDTSDRERLISSPEVAEFEAIVATVVALLETERDKDRGDRKKQKLESLFEKLSARDLLDKVSRLLADGKVDVFLKDSVEEHFRNLEETKEDIRKRFVDYSRMATIGTIAEMLVHEIRNRTALIGFALKQIKSHAASRNGTLEEEYDTAYSSLDALERLTDTFLPLANRNFARGTRPVSILEEQIRNCVKIRGTGMAERDITCRVPESETPVAVDPGELDAIILNLLQNAEYWLDKSQSRREIDFRLDPADKEQRVRVYVHDTGPGVDDDDVDRIFLPGVTGKPDGIGMGLTVASELVAAYGGNMSAIHPGVMGGASFVFDLPVQSQK